MSLSNMDISDRFFDNKPTSNEEAKSLSQVDMLFTEFAQRLRDWVPEGRWFGETMLKLQEAQFWAKYGVKHGVDHADAAER